jgi:CHAD domain-containing protein
MSVDRKRSRLAFQKLSRQLSKLSSKPAPENVHKFRTYGRRIEALLDTLIPHPNRNDRKLLRLLARLRRKAGRVRDLDVQISALRNLKIPQEAARKSSLIHALVEERHEREKKLARAFDRDALRDLRHRLKRAAADKIPLATDPLAIALRQLQTLARDRAPLTEKTLHRYRVVGKRARYLAELAGQASEVVRTVELLKRMQDVLGDWHDWLKLTERAEELFGSTSDSALVAALRNVTRSKFRKAVDVLAETRIALSHAQPAPPAAAPPRKAPVPASSEATAA